MLCTHFPISSSSSSNSSHKTAICTQTHSQTRRFTQQETRIYILYSICRRHTHKHREKRLTSYKLNLKIFYLTQVKLDLSKPQTQEQRKRQQQPQKKNRKKSYAPSCQSRREPKSRISFSFARRDDTVRRRQTYCCVLHQISQLSH